MCVVLYVVPETSGVTDCVENPIAILEGKIHGKKYINSSCFDDMNNG